MSRTKKPQKGAFGGKRGKLRKARLRWWANKGLGDQEEFSSGDSTLSVSSRLKKQIKEENYDSSK